VTRSKLPSGPKAHKPADSGVCVGNDARRCGFREVTLRAFKRAGFALCSSVRPERFDPVKKQPRHWAPTR